MRAMRSSNEVTKHSMRAMSFTLRMLHFENRQTIYDALSLSLSLSHTHTQHLVAHLNTSLALAPSSMRLAHYSQGMYIPIYAVSM